MSTILFNHIIFGPIKSRRLGNSLGVNLLPKFGKWCSFDCIYCECGWNKDGKKDTVLPTKDEVRLALESKLVEFKQEGTPIDTITFSGNGEPTLHPDFAEIIDFTLELRDRIFPQAKEIEGQGTVLFVNGFIKIVYVHHGFTNTVKVQREWRRSRPARAIPYPSK